MTLPALITDRFRPDPGFRVTVQTPEETCTRIINYVLTQAALTYGDYECVTFKTTTGTQQFRALGIGRNPATKDVVDVPCLEVSFFVEDDANLTTKVIEAIYDAHPYEEPVLFVQPCLRTLHIRGLDEDNPNRFWNAPPADWVPKEHQ